MTARIPPVAPPYDDATANLLARWMPQQAEIEPLLLFRTFAVHDELASRMRPLGAGILAHGRVPAREREIVIHRTCARTGAEYEWGVHAVVYGRPLGLTDEQLAATVHGTAEDPAWSANDSDLIELADQLHDTYSVDDQLWGRLKARYTDDQLLEVVITAGWYRLIAYVINAAGVEHEAWAMRFPAEAEASATSPVA